MDKLKAARKVHGYFRNLVVAATGTGKTLISAFDYRDFCKENKDSKNRILFVAHRKEILVQSLNCFRGILKDMNFGSLLVGNNIAESYEHLFVSIQSFNSKALIEQTAPGFYDYIVIDEFHHAAAKSYQKLLEYYKPKVLLGLTATPERADGKNIFEYFDGGIPAEMRLYEAIERKLLSPFHYFGVTDSVDLSKVKYIDGKYDINELENLFAMDTIVAKKRAGFVFQAVSNYCLEVSEIFGLGFCVSKRHAEFLYCLY